MVPQQLQGGAQRKDKGLGSWNVLSMGQSQHPSCPQAHGSGQGTLGWLVAKGCPGTLSTGFSQLASLCSEKPPDLRLGPAFPSADPGHG